MEILQKILQRPARFLSPRTTMVHRKISRDIKERALFLLDHPDLCDDVCAVLSVSRCLVERWQENHE